MIERKALIFNIQKYNTYDGPGVRTLVFFKGCPLRCKWCSNPESQSRQYQILFKRGNCVHCGACLSVCPAGVHRMSPEGRHEIDRDAECQGCRACERACPRAALGVAGESRSVSELMDIVLEDKPFYDTSGGGLTLGGGEALLQPEAAVSLLAACKQAGINTAIETCAYVKPEILLKAAACVDLFLFDVKHMDAERHHELTGARNPSILSNLALLLENRANVTIRLPLLKGVNDGERDIAQLADFLRPYQEQKNFKGIDVLPYHKLGVNKYAQLDREYPIRDDPSLGEGDLERIESAFRQYRLPVTIIRH